MGFSFTDIQVLALFAKYDSGGEGSIDYQEFIDNLMEKDFKGVKSTYATAKKLASMFKIDEEEGANEGENKEESFDYDSEFDEEEFLEFEVAEIKKVFEMIDKDKSGYIDIEEMHLLLAALDKEVPASKIEGIMKKLDSSGDGTLDFNEFKDWWLSQLDIPSRSKK